MTIRWNAELDTTLLALRRAGICWLDLQETMGIDWRMLRRRVATLEPGLPVRFGAHSRDIRERVRELWQTGTTSARRIASAVDLRPNQVSGLLHRGGLKRKGGGAP